MEETMKINCIKIITVAALLSLSTTTYANQWYLKKLDIDNDGSINVEEFKQHSKGWMDKKGLKDEKQRAKFNLNGFNKIDTNKDGKITFNEYEIFKKNKNKKNKKT